MRRARPAAIHRAVTFHAASIFLARELDGRTVTPSDLPRAPVRLSDGQREAILAPDGPLLITAGPGTGKTLTVAERIAHLVTTGRASLTEILALTFSRAAARTLTARLIARLGPAGAAIHTTTFHAFGLWLARRWPRDLGYAGPELAVYGEREARALLLAALGDGIVTPPDEALAALAAAVENARLALAQGGEPLAGIVGLAERYERLLREHGAIDFPAMLAAPLRLFREHPSILDHCRETYRWIVADECQDLSPAQCAILRLLAGERGNLTVVGDACQNVYEWRGADASFLLGFADAYPAARVVALTENFRSTGNILAIANALGAELPYGHRLWTANPPGTPPTRHVARDPDDEAEFVAGEIARLLATGALAGAARGRRARADQRATRGDPRRPPRAGVAPRRGGGGDRRGAPGDDPRGQRRRVAGGLPRRRRGGTAPALARDRGGGGQGAAPAGRAGRGTPRRLRRGHPPARAPLPQPLPPPRRARAGRRGDNPCLSALPLPRAPPGGEPRAGGLMHPGDRIDTADIRRRYPLAAVVARYGVALRRSGDRLVGRCPFHDDHDPSFTLYVGDPADEHFHCFGCWQHGDVIRFVELIERLPFRAAVMALTGEDAGARPSPRTSTRESARRERPQPVALHDATARACLGVAVALYHRQLLADPAALDYCAGRGLDCAALARHRLGYAPPGGERDLAAALRARGLPPAAARRAGLLDHQGHAFLSGRIVIPEVRAGVPLWATGRALDAEGATPKYLHLPGPRPLLGLAEVAGSREVYLAEGPFDRLALSGWGLPALALAGTRAPPSALDLLRRFERVYLTLDNDDAGRAATAALGEALGTRAVPVRLPGVKDVAELALRRDGRARFRHAVAAALAA